MSRLAHAIARKVSGARHLVSRFTVIWKEQGFIPAIRASITKTSSDAARRFRAITDIITRTTGRHAKPITNSALLIGYIDAQLGLGQSLRGLALALSQTAVNFCIYPFVVGVESRRAGSYMRERYDRKRAHAINIIEVSPGELPSVFKNIREIHFRDSYNILRAYWELSKAPSAWEDLLYNIDEIWAPTKFVADSFLSIFNGTVRIIPPSLELPEVYLDGRRLFRLNESVFYFLFSFDYYSSPFRKNPEGVLRAFRQAFPDTSTRVGLIIKSTGAFDHHPEIKEALLHAAEHDSRIEIIDQTITRQEMLALIKAADCYVSLHRAEGFGLGMVEAMAFGKPVIATDYSGSTDFLTEETGYPVSYRLTKVGADEYVYSEDQVWADPSEDDCAARMSQVFNNREEAAIRAHRGQSLVNERYSPANVGRLAEKRLNEVFAALAKTSGPGKRKA